MLHLLYLTIIEKYIHTKENFSSINLILLSIKLSVTEDMILIFND